MRDRIRPAAVSTLFLAHALLAACATPPPAIGMFEDSPEVLHGKAGLEYNTYTRMFDRAGSFEMRGADTGLVCSGRIAITRTSIDGEHGRTDITCRGQGGNVSAECEDERLLQATWTADNCKSGFGKGKDSNGTAFAFTFGIPERKAVERIERSLDVHRQRPHWPRTETAR